MTANDPFRKHRLDAAIDAAAVWGALFLTYISVAVLLAWKLIRALPRLVRLRGREPEI